MPRVGGRVAATSGARSVRVRQRSMAVDDVAGFDNFPPGMPAAVTTGAGRQSSKLFGEDFDDDLAVSTAGPVFRRRMRRNPDDESDTSWRDFIPVVEVAMKVIQVTAVNVAEQTFRLCFFLYVSRCTPKFECLKQIAEVLQLCRELVVVVVDVPCICCGT